MIGKDLLSIGELAPEDLTLILSTALRLKDDWQRGRRERPLEGKSLAMLFQKPSLRTRVSFEMAMWQLGGRALYLSPQEVQMGQRESTADVARVLSRYIDAIMARVYSHSDLEELAKWASVPVVNGLSDFSHPCQALADMLTIQERKGELAGLKLAYVGDGDNNVAHSLLAASASLGMHMAVASPIEYGPSEDYLALVEQSAVRSGSRITVHVDPRDAVAGADVVYTDVWTSMGYEEETERRHTFFKPYQVNSSLLAAAKPEALVMHDLPAHRGEEITDEVIDGPQSVVFDQAENRLHAQKAVLYLIMSAGGD
ncbi:MAG: ornithine carbamoyltransferase [Chloroflexota bacterium]